jgi:hypothetical protein
MVMPSISILPLFAAILAYLVARSIHRIAFYPLARFPCPMLAAITSMYGGWYNLRIEPSFCKQNPTLQDKYGPNIRILPNQLHIRDMET